VLGALMQGWIRTVSGRRNSMRLFSASKEPSGEHLVGQERQGFDGRSLAAIDSGTELSGVHHRGGLRFMLPESAARPYGLRYASSTSSPSIEGIRAKPASADPARSDASVRTLQVEPDRPTGSVNLLLDDPFVGPGSSAMRYAARTVMRTHSVFSSSSGSSCQGQIGATDLRFARRQTLPYA
jgi:hypothetical protein